ncbi:hypothetical protein [Deinococcus aquaticus]|uniref:hypothetical protein n=1 Tax=Deinococcus aquaticus TaxID=328692 RepID=UPI003615D1CB
MPWNVLVSTPLQALRPYKWQMNSGVAYKYAPTEGNRISAYSVYTAVQPGRPDQPDARREHQLGLHHRREVTPARRARPYLTRRSRPTA